MSALASSMRRAGLLTRDQHSVISGAIEQATAPKTSLGTEAGSALDKIRNMAAIPDDYRIALINGLKHLDTASSNKVQKSFAGPFERVGGVAGAIAGTTASRLIPGSGYLMEIAGVRPGAAIGASVLRPVDRLMGTPTSALKKLSGQAARVNAITGQSTVDDPLGAVRDLTAEANSLPQAPRQAKPLTTDQKFAGVEAAQRGVVKAAKARQGAYNGAFRTAESAGLAPGAPPSAPPDILTNPRFWKQPAAPDEAPNLDAVTRSQVSGFNADQRELAQRDAATAKAEERGQALNEKASDWIVRQQIGKFKKQNPDVPIQNQEMVRDASPQGLFAATGGKFGSPAGATDPGVAGITQGVSGDRQVTPRPVQTAPNTTLPPIDAEAQNAILEAFPEPMTGGKVLVNQILQHDVRQPTALHDEIDTATNEAALNGLPLEQVDKMLSGDPTTHPKAARYVASMVSHLRGLTAHPGEFRGLGSPDQEASQAIDRAFGAASAKVQGIAGLPNGPTALSGPVRNAHHYMGAANNYHDAVRAYTDLASRNLGPDHPVTLNLPRLHIAKMSADKEAIAQDLSRAYPEAAGYFPPELLKGK